MRHRPPKAISLQQKTVSKNRQTVGFSYRYHKAGTCRLCLFEEKMKRRPAPRASFKHSKKDLAICVLSLTVSEICELCGVGPDTAECWRTGQLDVPYMAYQLLRLRVLGEIPDFCGPWSGWRIVDDRIYQPGGDYRSAARQDELLFIHDYRIDRRLCTSQSETIDGLLRQRDWYKKQCGLESRMGLMLCNVFGQ